MSQRETDTDESFFSRVVSARSAGFQKTSQPASFQNFTTCKKTLQPARKLCNLQENFATHKFSKLCNLLVFKTLHMQTSQPASFLCKLQEKRVTTFENPAGHL